MEESVKKAIKQAEKIVKSSQIGDEFAASAYEVVLTYLLLQPGQTKGHQYAPSTVNANEAAEQQSGERKWREFLEEKNPGGEPGKTVCLMYYFQGVEEKLVKGITSSDLNELFDRVGEKAPQNVSQSLNRCAEREWIYPSDKKKKGEMIKWKLANAGRDYVEKLPERNKNKKNIKSKKKP